MPFAIHATAVAALALLIALALRYLLVEPQDIAEVCDPGRGPWWCWIRAGVIQSFATNGLGIASLLAGGLSWLRFGRALSMLAIVAGSLGAVLYNTDLAVPGLLLGLLRATRL
jgi:hypothetical protein